jgi:hypothetical protein
MKVMPASESTTVEISRFGFLSAGSRILGALPGGLNLPFLGSDVHAMVTQAFQLHLQLQEK